MVLLLECVLLAFVSVACLRTYSAQTSFVVHGASTSTSNAPDHLVHMSFKSNIRSDPSRALDSWGNHYWNIPRRVQWRGVVCGLRGNRRGRVVALDLAELNLLGTFTPALGNFTYMRRLNLAQNRFHGVLPSELGNLQDLETLQLSYNSIHGYIPRSLSNCSHLVNILIDANKLQGGIPAEFSSLHNVQLVNLANNRLTGRIPSSIGSLASLKQLILKFKNLTGEIPTEIGRLVNLNVLDLGFNQLYGMIPDSLGNLSALTLLSIPDNKLEGRIPTLQNLSFLNKLELGKNKLEGTIPSWLGNISSLEIIDLQRNGIVGKIPESLGSLEQLTILSLTANNLSGSIPHEIGDLHALTGLFIDINELEGSIPPSIFNLSSLQILNVQFNNLAGVFPPNIGSKLPKLTKFCVSYNQFQGMLPSSLCNVSMLQQIEAAANILSGTIPQCLGIHKNLTVLVLAGNLFEARNDVDWGFVASLTNCINLGLLDVNTNSLQGMLPNSIGNLSTQLEYLSIGQNSITGTVTEGIGNLINLDQLYMANNLLIGAIPESLGKLKKLNGLDLSNNAFSGPIPATLGNLTKLTNLNLGTNAITGAIPSTLSSCALEVLDLSHNNLSGPIPKELYSISTLSSFMSLAHNSLSGTLTSEVGNLKNIGELDFSCNMISGEIPTYISECQSLEYLNISGNHLQGIIPLSLGNLKGLSVLDLSYNNLSGTIPEILCNMKGLSSLNLSFNKFQGDLPTDGVFLNATAIDITGNDGLCGGIPQLKLPPCSNHTTKKPAHKLAIITTICSAFLFVTLVYVLSAFYQKSRKKKGNLQISVTNEQYMRVSYAELANATNYFASENLIGAGSFGSVYKGRMRCNDQHAIVAVKVFNLMQRGALQSFVAECETLRCARHRNLVKILTVCSSIDFQGRDFKAIVYEFLPNGNLDQWLHKHIMEDGKHRGLDLIARLHISIDVASSLDYLHQHKPMSIIHCDLKPSNVLLDSDMVARVGDFGLARFLHPDSEISSVWASMRGSVGYAAPEYGLGNEVSTHGDVYSYGILLLEMFTGKRPTDSEFGEDIGLRKYVQMALPGKVAVIADQQLLTDTEYGEGSTSIPRCTRDVRISYITSILQVGIRCSEETPTERAPIRDALKELQAIRDKCQKHLSSLN